jgi:hypothetical protein
MWVQVRSFFRLRRARAPSKMLPSSTTHNPAASDVTTVHRFEETINGRAYKIEVSAVTPGKWRAQIARVPGGSGALMPFYGRTPGEAAQELSRWLTLAHARSAPQV